MILDKHLSNIAKAMMGTAYTYPTYLSQSTTAVTVLSTNTVLPDEMSARFSLTRAAYPTYIDYSGISTGSSVTQATGSTIRTIALFSAATSGDMHVEVSIPSITQTTNFDINWVIDIGYSRQ